MTRTSLDMSLARSFGRHGLRVMLVAAVGLTLAGCGKGAHTGDPYANIPDAAELPAAIAAARANAGVYPNEPYWPYRLGELELAGGSSEEAEVALKRALWIDPYYAPALALLSKLYFDGGRHEEAIGYLEVARSAPGEFPDGFPDELRAGLAVHYDAIGEIEAAESLVRDLGGPQDHADVASALTYVTLRGDAFDEARQLAERALESNPNNAVNLNNYGITRLQAGDPHAAKAAFAEAHELRPALPGPCYNMAIVERFYFFDDDAARAWFERYWALSHDDPDGLADVFLAEAPGGEGR